MSAIIENGKKAVIKALEESQHDNIFLNMGVGYGYYVYGRKQNGVITTQMIEYDEEEAVREFTKDCRHIRETRIIRPPQATESETRMKQLEKRISKLEDIVFKKRINDSESDEE